MNTAIDVRPHGDDAAAFCGGTIRNSIDPGRRVVSVHVTADRRISASLTDEETTWKIREQLHETARLRGIQEVVELDFETYTLADVPLRRLRERFAYLFRKYRPCPPPGNQKTI